VAVDLDRVLGDTRPLWDAWLEDAARRFASIAPFDPASLPQDRAEAAAQLDRWAVAGVGNWEELLERFAEDRAPLHLRPDAEANAALRRLAADGVRLGAFSDAPASLARIAVATLGAARRLEAVEGGPGSLDRLVAELGGDVEVVRSRDELRRLVAQ
jgi:phosphoglycolate phosphatase-like HAD superfamily hydrolase